MFHEDGDEYIPLKITLLDVPGYYNIFYDDSKTMNFKLDDDLLKKLLIYLIILEKLNNSVFLQQCRYTFFTNNKLINDVLDFADTEPD